MRGPKVTELRGSEPNMGNTVEDRDGGGNGIVGANSIFERSRRPDVFWMGHAMGDYRGLQSHYGGTDAESGGHLGVKMKLGMLCNHDRGRN